MALFNPKNYLGKALDEKFVNLGLREYKIRYEGQKENLLVNPVEILPTPHISDLGISRLDRPAFSADTKRTKKEGDFYNIRQYSVKFNKFILLEIAEQINMENYLYFFSRNARYGILKKYENDWVSYKPLSEEIESFVSSDFVSIILQPEKGTY